ncbi:MAG: DUF4363 family protein [Bacillota bacterium]
MKMQLGIGFMLVLIVTIALMGYKQIADNSQEIHTLLGKLEIATTDNNWHDAREYNRKLQKKWNQALRLLPALIDHEELHDLEIGLARISVLVEEQQKPLLLPEISVARRLIKNIQNQEQPRLKNIF